MISKLSHVMLWARNLDGTVRWYCDKLGFAVDYHAPGEFASLSHPTIGRLDFHGAGKDSKDVGHGPLPYYMVDDIDATIAWLKARDVKVEAPQQVGDSPRHTWFWDCEGNQLGLEEV